METINRNNYEAWLMLYLDNELTATERQAVEVFCATHPQAQQELEGLKEVLLQPDLPASMPGKERLLMPAPWNGEGLTRQQERLLLLADNELAQGDKVWLENEIEASPLLQKEWALLQKAVLGATTPEEMPGKESLYRRQNARVVPFGRILRMAAAAAILGFGWFFANQLVEPGPHITRPANLASTANQNSKVESRGSSKGPGANSIGQNAKPAQKDFDGNDLASANFTETRPVKKELARPGEGAKKMVAPKQETTLPPDITPNPPALLNNGLLAKIESVNYVDIPGVDEANPIEIGQTVKIAPTIAAHEVGAGDMGTYQLIDANDVDPDESISIAGARISKQKIRNVYRNITRPLSRTFERAPAPRTEVR